ncbi:hypothetical protein FXO38_15560 [Capsicum annuum]|nr:hypothetical protein FXO38_15560 [Capsicum annuum]
MDPAMGRWKMKSGVFFLRPTVLVGELIGGSQREEDYEVLRSRMLDLGLPREPYEWYLDLRRHGTVKHWFRFRL